MGQGRVASVPEGFGTVTPIMISKDTNRLVDFAKDAFDAVESSPRRLNDDGTVGYAEVRVGESRIIMFDARPEWVDTPAFVALYLSDADSWYQQALDAGGRIVNEMTELASGDRVGRVRDPLGNIWQVQSRVADLRPEEVQRRSDQNDYVLAHYYMLNAPLVPSKE